MPRQTLEERREYQRSYHNARRNDPQFRDRIREQARRSAIKCYNPLERAIKVLAYKYGLTPEAYNALLVKQKFSCAICKTTEAGGSGKRFRVDHCHITGKVRGLLCNACNTGIGLMGESTVALKAAIAYLEEHA